MYERGSLFGGCLWLELTFYDYLFTLLQSKNGRRVPWQFSKKDSELCLTAPYHNIPTVTENLLPILLLSQSMLKFATSLKAGLTNFNSGENI